MLDLKGKYWLPGLIAIILVFCVTFAVINYGKAENEIKQVIIRANRLQFALFSDPSGKDSEDLLQQLKACYNQDSLPLAEILVVLKDVRKNKDRVISKQAPVIGVVFPPEYTLLEGMGSRAYYLATVRVEQTGKLDWLSGRQLLNSRENSNYSISVHKVNGKWLINRVQ